MHGRIASVKRVSAVIALCALAALVLAGCSAKSLSLKDCAVLEDTDFGGVYIDITIDEFNDLGFQYGDSVNIEFSNGYTLEGIPYYNGYYTYTDELLLVGYPGYPHIKAAIDCGAPLWEVVGLAAGDMATVTLAEAGAYADVQEAFSIAYTNERSDYPSDEAFANFRELSGGSLKPGVLYRGASPISNEYNRAAYVNAFLRQTGIAFVLDLSDDAEEIALFRADDEEDGVDISYFTELADNGKVAALGLGASYSSDAFKTTLATGLVELTANDGPYYVHCIEGKDRTGWVCILLEALAGARYDELLDDYMMTYTNYYGFTEESDSGKYTAIKDLRFDDMIEYLASMGGDAGGDVKSMDYTACARAYLQSAGMTDEQIDALVAKICVQGAEEVAETAEAAEAGEAAEAAS